MNLTICSNVLSSQTFVTDLAPIQRVGWRRSIRRLGGSWAGSFTYTDISRNAAMDFFNQAIGCDIKEFHAGVPTWRGMIVEIDEPIRNGSRWDCAVTAVGYAHTLSWLTVAGAYVDGTTVNASAWIKAIVDNQAEFIAGGVYSTNTNQVIRQNDFGFTLWDEITRITELGYQGTPWRFWIDTQRFARYEAEPTTPAYYSRGGIVRRRSLLKAYNSIGGTYIDGAGASQTLATATTAESIAKYGTRHLTLRRSGFPQAAMESLRDTTLKENAYPQPRMVSSLPGVVLYDISGRPLDPWIIQPLPVKDLLFPAPPTALGAFFSDDAISFVDEVSVGDNGVLSLRSWDFSEANLMELQYQYAQQTEELDYDITD